MSSRSAGQGCLSVVGRQNILRDPVPSQKAGINWLRTSPALTRTLWSPRDSGITESEGTSGCLLPGCPERGSRKTALVSLEVGRPVGCLRPHIPLGSCCIQTTPMPKKPSPCFLCSPKWSPARWVPRPGSEKPQSRLRSLWLWSCHLTAV